MSELCVKLLFLCVSDVYISHFYVRSLFFTKSGFMTLASIHVLALEIQSRIHLEQLISGLHNIEVIGFLVKNR